MSSPDDDPLEDDDWRDVFLDDDPDPADARVHLHAMPQGRDRAGRDLLARLLDDPAPAVRRRLADLRGFLPATPAYDDW